MAKAVKFPRYAVNQALVDRKWPDFANVNAEIAQSFASNRIRCGLQGVAPRPEQPYVFRVRRTLEVRQQQFGIGDEVVDQAREEAAPTEGLEAGQRPTVEGCLVCWLKALM
jgi:hypothetical protein